MPRQRRRIKRDQQTSQLLEGGEGPTGPAGSFEGSPSEFTTEGGRGTNTPDRYGGPLREDDDSPNDRSDNTGGQGGFSTLGGGTYFGEGSSLDAPRHGDWNRRSDESIREEVCQALTRHPDLDVAGLEVHVEGGEVTLSGRVEDRDARWVAEEVVESVPGVSLVHNQVRVSVS
ncbi:MAG: BON domain-containing protein [Gemmatimonadales bacterium]|nr:BON domain-containing protein [Gemmatimonadales bacterium]